MVTRDLAKVAVGKQRAGRGTGDGAMAGQVDGIGDQRRGDIGTGGVGGKHRHCIGDAEREGAPAPARGGDAADTGRGRQLDPAAGAAGPRIVADRDAGAALALPQRDVAAVVDRQAGEAVAGLQGRRQKVIGGGAGDGRHRGDEDTGEGGDGRHHPPRHRAGGHRPFGCAQPGQLGGKLGQQWGKGRADPRESRHPRGGRALGGDDHVRGAMHQPQPAPVGRDHDVEAVGEIPHRASLPSGVTGQGAPAAVPATRRPERMWSLCRPGTPRSASDSGTI